MKQTAVNYLIHSINEDMFQLSKSKAEWKEIFEQAKQMEKEQIIDAWLSAWKDSMLNPLEDKYYQPEAEQYYNETFKK